MDRGGMQGWGEDPFGLHEERYFSSGEPTKLVRDGGVESYDDPPAHAFWGAPRPAPQPAPTHDGSMPYLAPPDAGSIPRRKGRRAGYAIAGVVALGAAATLAAVLSGSGTGGHGVTTSPAAFVTASAARTLAQRTADVTVIGSVEASGQSVALRGTGAVDFTTDAMSLSLNAPIAGHNMVENEVLAGGNVYLGITLDGRNLTEFIAGRHWVALPLALSASTSLTGANPLSALSALERQGAIVRSLGSKTINGVSCRGYAVTPSQQAILAASRAEVARLGLPSSVADAILRVVQGAAPPTTTIWFDSTQLTRQMTISLQLNGIGSTGSLGGSVLMNFVRYGVPVHIAAPAASDTISYQQLLRAVGHLVGS